MSRPPFPMLRAAFWLMAAVILTELLMTLGTGALCLWLIGTGAYQIGACADVGVQIREVWAEMLAAVLALLLASRGGGAPPPDKPDTEGRGNA